MCIRDRSGLSLCEARVRLHGGDGRARRSGGTHRGAQRGREAARRGDERKEGEPAPAAPPSKAGGAPAAAAAAAAAALPKPPPSEEETRAEHVRELAEALEEQLRESYYGRVQVSLLLLAHKSALGEPLRAAHVLFVLSKFGLVFFLCFLQNIALAVVMDEQVRERERSLSAENVLPF